ncbi:Oidioi.mRNA.OKI2018_I69.PAR.g12757.t1.cds [Oikopleura dioica]|uniref:Oidioi.mRNA.OKI2018_I69.PAR.g12757.t1.cds n=1 Tax=Oikopleura dioica TaxID=34765 RepID=A0ABN7S1M1_OIKDI|nr:Oidioi.mRNA.OKI2018_I69.PAR.g12757.t1.cds [Oikopleura dioica]
MSELQKMIFLNAFWLALVASFGSYKSIVLLGSYNNGSKLGEEITVAYTEEQINLNFRELYLKCLIMVLLLSFCLSTYWLLYFVNPAQKIKSKTFISIVITTDGFNSEG